MSQREFPAVPVIVVGSGGFAKEIIDYLAAPSRDGRNTQLLGMACSFVREPAPATFHGVPYLGKLEEVLDRHPEASFVVGMGKPAFREKAVETILRRGCGLHTLVHPSAHVARDAEVGAGSVIAPFAVVNASARLGMGCVLNVFCSVGHDAHLGDYSVLSPYAAINGGGRTGRACFLGTRATIYPRVSIGNRCQVDTHSFVKADVGDRMIVAVRGEYLVLKNRLEKDP